MTKTAAVKLTIN